MKTDYFYYDLPVELIAQKPTDKRDCSRLLCLDKSSGSLEHKYFFDIIEYLEDGDCLILNDTRVLPARLYGLKDITGSKIEILLLKEIEPDIWEVLVKPGRKAKIGASLTFGNGALKAEVIDVLNDGNRLVKFSYDGNFYEILNTIGVMPLPPYIREKLSDKERYQTVYSKDIGSVAAPTAGLHFTDELLERIKNKGVKIGFVTLHVGLGTFRPVKSETVEEHHMHTEHYCIPKETAQLINSVHDAGHKVFAVGTTSCRTLESACLNNGTVHESEGDTNIFIYPGYKFKCIDALITNFHLPESTLIMLVSAFAGRDNIMNAYKEAVEKKYRFFSFGDAMLIK